MHSHELIRSIIERGNPRHLAQAALTSLNMLYKWTHRGDGARTNPLDRLAGLYRATRDRRLIDWICAQADGYFVPNPRPRNAPNGETLGRHIGRYHRDHAAFVKSLAEAEIHDGFTPEELRHAREKFERTKSTGESLLRNAEQGRFKRRVTAWLCSALPFLDWASDVGAMLS